MFKEIKEEIRFIKENPIVILLLLTVTGILPSLSIGIIYKILGV